MIANTNLSSLLAIEANKNSLSKIDNSLSKLSSGVKINSASDNSSGLSIADNLRTQASGINQALKNANSAIALLQIADKSMQEQSNILDFIKTKLIQSATDTTDNNSKQSILKDIKKSLNQYDNIASTTTYNGTTLLQNSQNSQAISQNLDFCVGVNNNNESYAILDGIQSNTSYGGTLQKDNITISGDIQENDLFTLTINGNSIFYLANSSDVGNSTDKYTQVALGLQEKINNDPVLSKLVSISNNSGGLELTSKIKGNILDINVGKVRLNTNITLESTSSTEAQGQTITYTFGGALEVGDKYTIAGLTYEVQKNDTKNDVIDKLVSGLNGASVFSIQGLSGSLSLSEITASRDSNGELKLTANVAGVSFTPPSTSTQNLISTSDEAIVHTTIQNNNQDIPDVPEQLIEKTYTLDGSDTFLKGDGYTITINGTSVYTQVTSDTMTRDDIVNDLYTKLSNEPTLSNITFSLETNTIRMKSANDITISTSEMDLLDTTIQTASLSTIQQSEQGSTVSRYESYTATFDEYTSATVQGTGNYSHVNVGDVLKFDFGNSVVSYTVSSSDYVDDGTYGYTTALNAAKKLKTLVENANSNISVTITENQPKFDFKVEANGFNLIDLSSAQLRIDDNYYRGPLKTSFRTSSFLFS